MFTILLPLLVMSDPVPIAGRPADFSGAVGGPFVVTMSVDKTEVAVQERMRLTITIDGEGDLEHVQSIDLTNNREFSKNFDIAEGPTRKMASPKQLEFQFVIVAKNDSAEEIPHIRFVYFNPRIKPAAKGWQTTYSEAVKLIVLPLPFPNSIVAPEVKAWIQKVQNPLPPSTIRRVIDSWHRRINQFFGKSQSSRDSVALLAIFWTLPIVLGLLIRYRCRLSKTTYKLL